MKLHIMITIVYNGIYVIQTFQQSNGYESEQLVYIYSTDIIDGLQGFDHHIVGIEKPVNMILYSDVEINGITN